MVRRGREDQWSVGDGSSCGELAARVATTCRMLSCLQLFSALLLNLHPYILAASEADGALG